MSSAVIYGGGAITGTSCNAYTILSYTGFDSPQGSAISYYRFTLHHVKFNPDGSTEETTQTGVSFGDSGVAVNSGRILVSPDGTVLNTFESDMLKGSEDWFRWNVYDLNKTGGAQRIKNGTAQCSSCELSSSIQEGDRVVFRLNDRNLRNTPVFLN